MSEKKPYSFGSITLPRGKWIVIVHADINQDIVDGIMSIALGGVTYAARGTTKSGGGLFSVGYINRDTDGTFSFESYGYVPATSPTITANAIAVRVG